MEPILQVKNLSVEIKSDDKNLKILRNINFSLSPSSTLAIVGESGCGKTISALSIIRILPEWARITSGEVFYKGTNLLNLPDKEIRKIRGNKISMVFQEPMTSLNPVLTIGKQISETLVEHENLSKEESLKKSTELLKKLGIPNADKRLLDYPHNFSGGMRQRVMIAIALSCNPDIVIADEPTTALDVTIQAQILKLLGELQKETRMSLILITHNFGIVAQTADEVVVIYAGRIMEKSTTKELFKKPNHPYTKLLLESLPKINKRKETLKTIQGAPPSFEQELTGCAFAPRCPYVFEKCFKLEPPEIDLGETRTVRCWKYNNG